MNKLLFISFILPFQLCRAQKGIEKLTAHKIDSLQRINVDIILDYSSYCGECDIKGSQHTCYLKSGYLLADKLLIYKERGKYYMLSFGCYNSGTKRQLDTCRSIPYFITIIPDLNARDKFFKDQWKKGLFPRPMISDGFFENAEIIIKKKKQYISMAEAEKTDLRDTDKTHFWVDKEIELLKLVSEDVTVKKSN